MGSGASLAPHPFLNSMNRVSALAGLAAWAPPLLWMGVIFVLSSQPDRPHLAEPSIDRWLEPVGHTLGYAVLAYLWARTLRGEGLRPIRVLWAALVISALYALFDEWHQSSVPSRQADLADLFFDAVGIATGLMGWERSGGR